MGESPGRDPVGAAGIMGRIQGILGGWSCPPHPWAVVSCRVGASCHLYQALAGVQVLPPSPGTPELEVELGPPPGSSHSLPPLHLCLTHSGEVQLQVSGLGEILGAGEDLGAWGGWELGAEGH